MLPQPSLTTLASLQPPVFKVSKDSLLLVLLLLRLASQVNNYSPNKKCPSDSPPSERSWVCDSPPFSSLQPQLRESVLQWVPKTVVSAPPPPPRAVTPLLTPHPHRHEPLKAGGGHFVPLSIINLQMIN